MRAPIVYFATLLAIADALTFTSPTGSQSLDPTQPITVQWTADSSDPSTFDLIIDKPGGLVNNKKIATGLLTSSGNYIVAANAAAMTYGNGFVLKARSAVGDILATSPSFALSVGSPTTVDGRVSYTWTNTFTGTTKPTGTAQGVFMASIVADSLATSSDVVASSGGTETHSVATASKIGTVTQSSSGFSTSTLSRSSESSTQSLSTSSASATTSQNAQPKLGSSGQIALTCAGVLAGLAALLA
ncbi:hypothetical protein LTR70_003258 [Exophiala xenobiotica]|uniref:Yeast cell wall synthesis Kre9/Knh1-like N-terminal domain-containing protein n=1 Tax=Lithohypha guttulata TaxID=1690604 RepID=A0ABR0KLJ2_9EURO|nr:hypothetical protein LTR24_001133 [Lithohypha guttulata]KAK5323580.1 hypothetical protein LTR70_003258 [Exophiala xenobiotica]